MTKIQNKTYPGYNYDAAGLEHSLARQKHNQIRLREQPSGITKYRHEMFDIRGYIMSTKQDEA